MFTLDDMNWQPIETAPKDGTKILVWAGKWDEICIAAFSSKFGWMSRNSDGPACFPTHWQPLPEPPQ